MFPFEIKPQDTFLYKMGLETGEKLGEKLGVKNKQDNMILALLKKGKLPVKDIAEVAGVSVAYVMRLKKKAGV
jgi:DNA-directed RNA polymerase specialized sigma subunit